MLIEPRMYTEVLEELSYRVFCEGNGDKLASRCFKSTEVIYVVFTTLYHLKHMRTVAEHFNTGKSRIGKIELEHHFISLYSLQVGLL